VTEPTTTDIAALNERLGRLEDAIRDNSAALSQVLALLTTEGGEEEGQSQIEELTGAVVALGRTVDKMRVDLVDAIQSAGGGGRR
jgi:hypothetical protein